MICHADDLWSRPVVAYNVQVRFDAATRTDLHSLCQMVASPWSGAFYTCPPGVLHVSVYSLVAARSTYDKSTYWAENCAACLSVLASVCSTIDPFTIDLSELRATDTAVIAIGHDGGSIDTIRAALREGVPAPPIPVPSYDLIHTTLLRYHRPALLPDGFEEDIARLPIRVTLCVDTIVVVRERIYPSLEGDILATFALSRFG